MERGDGSARGAAPDRAVSFGNCGSGGSHGPGGRRLVVVDGITRAAGALGAQPTHAHHPARAQLGRRLGQRHGDAGAAGAVGSEPPCSHHPAS
jgi:hypothetical protein